MPRAYQSERAALSDLWDQFDSEKRCVDLALRFVVKSTGEDLLFVGGRWNPDSRQFVDPSPDDLEAVTIGINDNQVGVVRAFERNLRARLAGEPRKPFILTGGNRRGGKTWIVARLALATAIALPSAIIFMVSPSMDRRAELERYQRAAVPAEWWRQTRAHDFSFTLPNGSTITHVTGATDDGTKRGEADLVVYNEAQLMQLEALTNGVGGIIDQGGLILLAGNPSDRRGRRAWFTRFWRLIADGKYEHGEVCQLDRRDNPNADTATGEQIGQLIKILDPAKHKADDEGIFREPGNFVYAEHFDEDRNTVPALPDALAHGRGVITAEVIRARGVYDRRDRLCGADFQVNYGNAGVEVTAAGDVRRPMFYVTRALVVEGDETLFLDDAYGIWERERTLWIGDPSGAWQDAPHSQAGFRGRDSYQKFAERLWKILPPMEKRSDRGEFAAHPPVADCINLVNLLLDEGRLIVCMDAAAVVAEALRRCEYGGSRRRESLPSGVYAHLTDALRYLLYWATPRPSTLGRVPPRNSLRSISPPSTGVRIL